MAHAIWTGSINFGLVTIPVKLQTAIRTNDLKFNFLHKTDEGRIHNVRRCSIDGEEVGYGDLVNHQHRQRDHQLDQRQATRRPTGVTGGAGCAGSAGQAIRAGREGAVGHGIPLPQAYRPPGGQPKAGAW